jgi:acyl-CoA thioester hydrolase
MRRVWHGSYVAYLEDGRESFGRHFPGIGYDVMQRLGIYAPVYDIHIRYLAPLQLDDTALVYTTYVPRRGARLDFSYKVIRQSDQTLCAEAATTQLFIDNAGQLLLESPEFFELWKQQHLHT